MEDNTWVVYDMWTPWQSTGHHQTCTEVSTSLAQLDILPVLFSFFFYLPYRVMGFIVALVVFCLFCILRQRVLLYNLAVLEFTKEIRLAWHSQREVCLLLNARIRHVLPSQRTLGYIWAVLCSHHCPSISPPLPWLSRHMSHYLIGNHSCPWCVSSGSVMASDSFETGF